MRAGDKNRRIRIEILSITKSGFGTDTETWSLLREVWAELTYIPIKAQEVHAGQEIISEMFAQFKIDFIAGLSPKGNRIIFEGQVYDIWHLATIGYREALLVKTRLQPVGATGSNAGISGSSQMSSPPTPSAVIRMGTVFIETPIDGTIPVVSYAEYPFTINGLNNLRVATGSLTLTVQINGINVTGLSNLSVTSTPQSPSATGANSVSVGDRITVVLSNSAAPTKLEFTLKGTV